MCRITDNSGHWGLLLLCAREEKFSDNKVGHKAREVGLIIAMPGRRSDRN